MNMSRIRVSFDGVLIIQLAMAFIVVADVVGVGSIIPQILRMLIGLVYLSFVPGFLIIKVLKIRGINITKIILYSVGLSVTFMMFFGLLVNITLHDVGISRPLSYVPIVGGIMVVTSVLYVLSLVLATDNRTLLRINFREVFSSSFLLLLALPLLSILGAYMVNTYENNVILLLLIVAIVCSVIIVSNDRTHGRLYSVALFLIAISLLYHRSLITNYLIGWDNHVEYNEYNLLKTQQYWNSSRAEGTFSAILSISILPEIYSLFLNMDGVWIFKIVFPLLYAIVPVGLFEVYRKQLDDKLAFLSSFFFMSFFTFFQEMLQLGREQIAEMFFVLCILIIFETRIERGKRTFLFMIFSISMVVSHYATAFSFAGYIFLTLTVLSLRQLVPILRKVNPRKSLRSQMPEWHLAFFVVVTLCWYLLVSNGIVLTRLGATVYFSFSSIRYFLEGTATHPVVQLALGEAAAGSWGREIYRVLFYGLNGFIVLCGLQLLIKPEKSSFDRKYSAFALASLAILVFSLISPFFPAIMNATRVYHIVLIFLAPVCIFGGKLFFKIFEHLLKVPARLFYSFMLIILVIFFLFNTGFIFEVAHDVPSSISLSKYRIDGPYFSDEEVLGVRWLVNRSMLPRANFIYGDEYGVIPFWGYFSAQKQVRYFTNETTQIQENTYVFLRYLNVKTQKLLVRQAEEVDIWGYINITSNPACFDAITNGSKIYDNGYCNVFLQG